MSRGSGPGGTRRLRGPPATATPDRRAGDHDPLVGQTIAGRYTLVERIGRGGMGTVYRAHHDLLGRDVALKLLRPELLATENGLARFRREAQTVANIDSPHVVKIIDFGVAPDDRAFLVMEHLRGRTLRRVVSEGPMEPRRVVALSRQVLAALEDAHRHGVFHRDIKPENIFICDGRPEEVKVLDFGLAKVIGPVSWTEAGGLTESGEILGTPHYMAPEQARTDGEVGPRSDLYSLGVVMYEMLTGERPFQAASALAVLMMHNSQSPIPPNERSPELGIPAVLESAVLRAMGKQPEERFDSAAAMKQELDSLEQAAGEWASRPGPRRRHGWPLWPLVAGAMALSVLGVVLLVPGGDEQPPLLDPATVVGPPPGTSGPDGQPARSAVTSPSRSGVDASADSGERVTLVVQPSLPGARVSVDGRPAGVGLVRLVLPRSGAPVTVQVRARGHKSARRIVVPDRDRVLPVELQPIFRPGRRLGLERNPYDKGR